MVYFRTPDCVVEDCETFVVGNATGTRTSSGLSVRVEYFNFTGYPVTVVDRRGVSITLDSSPLTRGLNPSVYVVVGYVVSNSSVIFDRPGVSNADLQYQGIYNAITEGTTVNTFRNTKHTNASVTYEIAYPDLMSRGAVYYRNLDIVISAMMPRETPAHPYEQGGALRKELEDDEHVNSRDAFGFGIKLVDVNGRFGQRYININGRVYKVPVSRDSKLRDGIYIKTSERVTGDVGEPPPPEIGYYSFEEYHKACDTDLTLLKLFTTIDQARSLGDMMTERKVELEQLAYERKLEDERFKREKQEAEQATEKLKQDFAREVRDYETKNRKIEELYKESEDRRREIEFQAKAQEHEMKLRMSQLRHEIDMDKLRREESNSTIKDIGDILKNTASVLGAAAVLYVAYDKFKAKTTP